MTCPKLTQLSFFFFFFRMSEWSMTAALRSHWLWIVLRKSLAETLIKCNYLWKAACRSQFNAIYCWITRKHGFFSDASRKSLLHSHTNPPCLDCSVLKRRSVGKKNSPGQEDSEEDFLLCSSAVTTFTQWLHKSLSWYFKCWLSFRKIIN